MRRLHWGCGPLLVPGWENSDRVDFGQSHVGDLLDGLPYDDGTFEVVVANHALQMIPLPDVPRALRELVRVTDHGGVVRVLVPDLLAAVRAYARGDRAHFLIDDAQDPTIDGKLCRYLTQNGSTRSLFTPLLLLRLMGLAGLEAATVEPGVTLSGCVESVALDSRPDESIIAEGIKP